MGAIAIDGYAVVGAPAAESDAELLVRNGITRIRADQYHVDGYRYSNLADAQAQVRRGAGAREMHT